MFNIKYAVFSIWRAEGVWVEDVDIDADVDDDDDVSVCVCVRCEFRLRINSSHTYDICTSRCCIGWIWWTATGSILSKCDTWTMSLSSS